MTTAPSTTLSGARPPSANIFLIIGSSCHRMCRISLRNRTGASPTLLSGAHCGLPTKSEAPFLYIFLIVKMPSITWRQPARAPSNTSPHSGMLSRASTPLSDASGSCEKQKGWHASKNMSVLRALISRLFQSENFIISVTREQ